MKKKFMATMLLTAAAVTALTVPASAKEQTITSKSGIITITLPSEDWKEGAADNRCAVFSDGTDFIAFNHYKIGEDKPEIVDSKGKTYETYQTIKTQDGYFLEVVGYCDDTNADKEEEEKDMDLIVKAVNSAEFHMDRMHNDDHKMKKDEMTVEAVDMIMYCIAPELNIRPDGEGAGNPIAVLHMGDQVHITGIVKKNGIATGWVKVEWNGVVGYASNTFLSFEKPGPKEPEKPQKTGYSTEVFYINGNAVIIFEYTDGTWKDDNGVEYWRTVDREWSSSDGATLYDYIPDLPQESVKTGASKEIYWLTGNAVTIFEYTDGNWYDDDGIVYWYQPNDDSWYSSQGDTLYDDPNALINRRNEFEGDAGDLQEDYGEFYDLIEDEAEGYEEYVEDAEE